MYIPRHFEVTDPQEIISFFEKNGFAQLISLVDGRLFSTHMPFMVKNSLALLQGHFARSNPQWHSIAGQQVLVTFLGPHEYISPSWYSSPGVPTWNYQAVHVYGNCRIFHDQDRLKTIVDELVAKYESAFAAPWTPQYQSQLLQGIVGIEIEVTEIQAKYKLNQNRSESDRLGVIRHLDELGESALSEAMKKYAL